MPLDKVIENDLVGRIYLKGLRKHGYEKTPKKFLSNFANIDVTDFSTSVVYIVDSTHRHVNVFDRFLGIFSKFNQCVPMKTGSNIYLTILTEQRLYWKVPKELTKLNSKKTKIKYINNAKFEVLNASNIEPSQDF